MDAPDGEPHDRSPRIDVPSSDRLVIRPWFQGRAEFSPRVRDISAGGFELVGARLDRIGTHQAIVVVYRLREHVIDVYSWRKSRRSAPGDRGATSKTIRGFNVVGWDEQPIPGLYAAGNSAARMESGAVMQSGVSNARGMTYGWLAGRHAAGVPSDLLDKEIQRLGSQA